MLASLLMVVEVGEPGMGGEEENLLQFVGLINLLQVQQPQIEASPFWPRIHAYSISTSRPTPSLSTLPFLCCGGGRVQCQFPNQKSFGLETDI
jgi:hypothetical protein